MSKIKCPNCGEPFSVDDANYASILNQVKNQAFEEEVASRLHEVEERMALEHKNQELAKEQQYQEELGKREAAIKEKEGEIERMKQREEAIRQEETLKHEKSMSDMKVQMEQLKAEVQQNEERVKMARLEEQNKSKEELHKKESEIEQLKLQAVTDKKAASEREQNMQNNYAIQLKQANELVEYYKDMKIRMSTKMIGESLEQHCSTVYNTTLRSALPNAYFEKDNDAADGSKGDFIFRDYDDGMEYISIMFEMKNEMDDTEHKHKNEDFLKKLDSDRKKKNCEYAVLVSLLEADNELYNAGIVDMSHKYEKMYVIRPQFFIPMITLLMQASRKSVVYQRKLAIAEQQTIDISNFADKIEKFKDAYGKNLTTAQKKYHDAIEQIDKSIAALQKVKENLMGSENALLKASGETEKLSIKKLTWGNKTMREKLEAEQGEGDVIK
ncbi:MAG: DUF2130 domain-containing protein [Bacteroidales bacterium]|nr:DUF2130 domain-containing protein [Bacteroidales bacterium]